MARYKLTLEYDGRFFSGWQKQTGVPTVQETLEEALAQLTGESVTVFGAGRTDRGVHATGQVAHVDIEKPISLDVLCRGTNFYLKEKAVVVLKAKCVFDTFHARFSAQTRTYSYFILNRPSRCVLEAGRVWWVCPPLNLKRMQEGAQYLIGHHDFSSFRARECQASSPFKTLDLLETHVQNNRIEIRVQSRSFLHSQIRIIVGTLKWVGEGRWAPEDVQRALDKKDRRFAGPTAPPEGLYLTSVSYLPEKEGACLR